MTTYEQQFRDIMAKMLQMDQPGLDFGIYRIMNQKRKSIVDFLDRRLVPEVTATLKANAEPGADIDAMESEVFTHLTRFFSRYYEEGDFVSKHRYKKDVYAIPYSGEEVKLYWANADQYYIKTSENFRDYAFRLPACHRRVHFVLRDATTEQNNNKTAKDQVRHFKLCEEDFISVENDELNVYFTYDLMPKTIKQDALIKEAETQLVAVLGDSQFADFSELVTTKAPTSNDKNRTLLRKHLQDYTAKNSFDYFIHKDLGGFLRRELDFYIKNEVMFLDDLDVNRIMAHLALVKAIKQVGEKIIVFLAQLEDFQKKLWLKKKFVVGCDYCITLDRVPRTLYPEIIANEAQRKEWVRLFAIDEIKGDLTTEGYSEPLTEKFLDDNPFLVLDTKFFSVEFKHRLVGSMENVDEQCNGLLINSENFQALELLQEKYREKIGAMITDPPYNTGGDDFLYKDNYSDSSWLSLMDERLKLSEYLLRNNAWISININDIELYNLVELLGIQEWDNINQICVKMSHLSGMKMSHIDKKIPKIKEQIVMASKGDDISLHPIYEPCEWDEVFSRYVSWMDFHNSENPDEWTKTTVRAKAKELGINVKDKDSFDRFRIEHASNIFRTAVDDAVASTPKDGKVRKIITAQGLEKYILNGEDVLFASSYMKKIDGKLMPVQPKGDIWTDIGINNVHNEGGVQLPNGKKPVKLFERLVNMLSNDGDYILDMFAGSATIVHACLNSENNHKYIAIQSGYSYFTDKTLRRAENVVYSTEWKLDKPVSRKGISQCFKYIRLEQYEDTLDNLQVKEQALDFGNEGGFGETYLLRYMLDTETRGDLFNIKWFEHPFAITIKTRRDNELVDTPVDMVETFNYLIGLQVETLRWPKDGYCVVEGVTHIGQERTLVIWRDCEKVSNEALNEFFRKQAYSTTDSEFDKIYVNGDNTLPNLRKDEEHWKVVLIEEEFKKRMFE